MPQEQEAVVVQIHPWQGTLKGLVGIHVGQATLIQARKDCVPSTDSTPPIYRLYETCGGEVFVYDGDHDKMRFTCATCQKEFISGLHRPDVIDEWCWTACLSHIFTAEPEQYWALQQDGSYSRFMARKASLKHQHGDAQDRWVLEFKRWVDSDMTLLVTGLMKGSIGISLLETFSSAIECHMRGLSQLRGGCRHNVLRWRLGLPTLKELPNRLWATGRKARRLFVSR